MSQKGRREVEVVHELLLRTHKGAEQMLLLPHGGWGVRAPLTMKVRGGVEATLAAIAQEAFDGQSPPVVSRLPLASYSVTAWSPTYRCETVYHVKPWVTRYERRGHDRTVKALGGEWVSRSEALALADLSPTVRPLAQQLRQVPDAPLDPRASEGDWTARLLYARDRDQRAFGPLFQEMTPFLKSRLKRFVGRTDIDDVLMETANYALADLASFQPIAQASTWLERIARNVAYTLGRRRACVTFVSMSAEDGDMPVFDRGPQPQAVLEQAEDIARGRAVLAELKRKMTPVRRMAWRLRFEEGLEYNEISECLRVPQGTVATWVKRTTDALRKAAEKR